MTVELVKAHAYGNDFLLARREQATGDLPDLARAVCARHTGIGADGLLLYTRETTPHPSMQLLNADGSPSEISGNGLRCLAALLVDLAVRDTGTAPPNVTVATEAGPKRLSLVEHRGSRSIFRAAMGMPRALALETLDVAGEAIEAVTLDVGNPQCVVLGSRLPDTARFASLGPALATHPRFPHGTNVEFAQMESTDRVRILIWERGVGPTSASGTGACAAAVAAAAYGGASRRVQVQSAGGTQEVEWTEDDLFLTGEAELLFTARWPYP